MKVTKKEAHLGKRIKKLRRRIKITQENLADKTNLSTTFIGLIEIGGRKPSLKSLQKIAKALKVKVKDLMPF